MKVLLSIKPEFVRRIFDGTKKFEYRRSIFKKTQVRSVVVYASAPVRRVVGEFEIESIIQDSPIELWKRTRSCAGIAKSRFLAYFTGKDIGYAIKIGRLVKYDCPMKLIDVNGGTPPQSFIYLETE